jgi:mannose-6-phosphate isomerase-like protein (cupin superfamily)
MTCDMQVTSNHAASVNHAHFQAGPLAAWRRWEFAHPHLPRKTPGKLFLQEVLALTGVEISLSVLPPGFSIPFLHRHRRNEEVYIFVSGRGQFQVDGQVFDIGEGSVVRVDPAGVRTCRNTGDVPLTYLVVQAPAGGAISRTIDDGEAVAGPVTWP